MPYEIPEEIFQDIMGSVTEEKYDEARNIIATKLSPELRDEFIGRLPLPIQLLIRPQES